MNSIGHIGSKAHSPRATLRRAARGLGCALLAGTSTLLAAPNAAAQSGANHSLVWTSGDIIFIHPAGFTGSRVTTPALGTSAMPYNDVSLAVNDILWNALYTPVFPVVFNVQDGGTALTSYPVSNLRIPAYGVKLQTLSNAVIELNGGMTSPPVLRVDTEGPRGFPIGGSLMPASIIQGFTIRDGGTGVHLEILTSTSNKPIRTEVRDCFITENKFQQIFPQPDFPFEPCGGGTGIRIITHQANATQYVIENNEIFFHGDFFRGDNGPSSRGIHISVPNFCEDSTLIRGNKLHRQETGIQIQGVPTAWARPRILSNFLFDHEQQVFSQAAGPVLFNDTIFRDRDFCLGPDRHVVHHQAPPIIDGTDPLGERNAMIVRNCIIEHSVPAIEPGGPPPVYVPTWPVDSFCGGGSVVLSNSDIELIIGVFPQNTAPGSVICFLSTPTLLTGNFFGRATAFVNLLLPDLHLLPAAVQAESGDAKDIEPGIAMILVGNTWLPCDVRTDFEGDVRLIDLNRDGMLVPDRGGDEVNGPPTFGMTMTSNADRTGNLPVGATLSLVIKGMPNDLAIVQGWLDCATDPADDVIYNNLNVSPVGNVLLPQCGVINSALIILDATGTGTLALPLAGLPETQVYFQAFAVTGGSNPALGTASNRVRIEIN